MTPNYIAYLYDSRGNSSQVYLYANSLDDAADRTKTAIHLIMPGVSFKPFWSNGQTPAIPGWWIQSYPGDYDRRFIVYAAEVAR